MENAFITSINKLNFRVKVIMLFTFTTFISLVLFSNFEKKSFFIFSFIFFGYSIIIYSLYYKIYELENKVYNDLENIKYIVRKIK